MRDKISGFEGTVVVRAVWLYGCIRCGVQSSELYEGKPIEPQWFDEGSLELLEQSEEVEETAAVRGGPRSDPPSGRSGE